MTAGFAGMIGTYILGPRIGFFKNKDHDPGSFEFNREMLQRQQDNLTRLQESLTHLHKEVQDFQEAIDNDSIVTEVRSDELNDSIRLMENDLKWYQRE